jgi:polar amino acid transport system permease protein/polar amino acid transport system substrate-binding protein
MTAGARNHVLVTGLLWLPLVSIIGCGGARSGGALDRIRARGELTWGADEQGGEPYVFEDAGRGGALVGFEVDLAQALARALGVRARFVQNDWSTLVPSLERGTFDVAMNGIEVTPALAARVAFSRPYYRFSEQLVARRGDARVRDLASTRGLRVGTLAGSLSWELARGAGADAVPYEGVDEPFADLAHGRIDAVLLDDIIVARYAPRHPTVVTVADVTEGSYAIAIRPRDEDLRQAIDRALGAEIASGAWQRTLARWQIDSPRQAARAVAPAPAAAHGAGRALGLGLTLVRLESRRLGPFAAAYVEIVRGTPVLLQLYVLYYGLADVIALGPWSAAIIGLGLNYAAYEAEIYRGAIQAIPAKQWEAALAIGMSRRAALRHVILPQALRIATPGVTNDFISLLKDSSLVSVLTVVELTKRMTITAVDNRGWLVPGALCAALYFLLGYPLTRLARKLERRGGDAGAGTVATLTA